MYETVRLIHIVVATILAGGMASDMVSHAFSRARFDPRAARFLFGKFVFADTWITPVLIVLMLGSGFWLAALIGADFWRVSWLSVSLGLSAASGIGFGIALMPLQKAIVALTEPWRTREPTPVELETFVQLDRRWSFWALTIGLLTLAILLLMLKKPF